MALVPKDLLEQIADLERLFTVPTEKLITITDRFVDELEKGLSKEGGSIPMLPAWVMGFPDGTESGAYLALDMGGTNLRVCEVVLLNEGRKFDMIQSKYRMPAHLRTGTGEELFDYIANCLDKFLKDNEDLRQDNKMYHLGFTFSYPCEQKAIYHGVLQRWTKGFDVSGVEGQDVVPMFEAALKRRGVPIKVTAVVNDTTGTLIASNYADPNTQIGCIFGTGCNAAYMEHAGSIPKLADLNLPPDLPMAINCEWGAFDNEHLVLPRTNYDVEIDRDSPRPGQQAFEKMIAGYYLGEVFRLVLLDLHSQNLMFEGKSLTKLMEPYSLDTSVLAEIEADPFENLIETGDMCIQKFGLECNEAELRLIRRLAELIGLRAARLSACGVAAIAKKKNIQSCSVGADGSVFTKYPHFGVRLQEALVEIFGPERGKAIVMKGAEDGSGVGAALIAAITVRRKEKGIMPDR